MIDMNRFLLKLFCPADNPKQSLLSFGVIVILSIGIGIFWTVQVVCSNYYQGLVNRVLQAKEEITIAHNPDKKFLSSEDEDEEFFNGGEISVQDRVKISQRDYDKISHILSQKKDICFGPLIKEAEFSFSMGKGETLHSFKCLLIGIDTRKQGDNVLPILDHVTSDPATYSTESVPVYLSRGLIPQVKRGDIFTITVRDVPINCVCIDFLPQDDLFAIDMMVLPVTYAQKFIQSDRFTFVGIRVKNGNGKILTQKLESQLGDEYLVSHWSESLKTLSSVFSSINFIINAIISSLFVIAFLFSLVTFDAMIKRKKMDLALLLAMGMPPRAIRKSLICAGAIIGCIGCVGGFVLTCIFLKVLPCMDIGAVLSTMYITDFSFSFDLTTFILVIFIAFFVTVVSAWFAGKRIFKIDPIEDLRK